MVDDLVHLAERVAKPRDASVFTSTRGRPLRYSNLLRSTWRPAAERAGLAGFTPHVLRHTAATLLIDAGASVKDVQRHLGDADASMTLNVYSAVMEGRYEELARWLDGIRAQAVADAADPDDEDEA